MEQDLQKLNPDLRMRASVPRSASLGEQFDAQGMRNKVLQERVLMGSGGEGQPNVSMYTGSKPQQLSRFVFQSLIITADEPARVEAQYVKQSLGLPLHGVLALVVVAICWLAWRLPIGTRMARVGVILASAIVVLGVRTLSEGAYRTYMTTVLAAMLVAGLCLFVYTTWAALRRGLELGRARRQAPAPQ